MAAGQAGGRAFQFLAVVNALRGRVAAELLQSAVGAAIGVQHQDHAPGAVQANGFANLFQDEFAFGLQLGRCQALGATGDLDRVGIETPLRFRNLRNPSSKRLSKHQMTAASHKYFSRGASK